MKPKRINPNRIHLIKQGSDKPQTTVQVTAIPAPTDSHGRFDYQLVQSRGIPLVMVKEAETK